MKSNIILMLLLLVSNVWTNEENRQLYYTTDLIPLDLQSSYDTSTEGIPTPPIRPLKFRNKQHFKEFLIKLHEYYAIVGRPRFGRSIDKNKASNCETQIEKYHQMVINLIDNFQKQKF